MAEWTSSYRSVLPEIAHRTYYLKLHGLPIASLPLYFLVLSKDDSHALQTKGRNKKKLKKQQQQLPSSSDTKPHDATHGVTTSAGAEDNSNNVTPEPMEGVETASTSGTGDH